MNMILTHDTRYGPVSKFLNDLVRFLGHSTEQSQESALQCSIFVFFFSLLSTCPKKMEMKNGPQLPTLL